MYIISIIICNFAMDMNNLRRMLEDCKCYAPFLISELTGELNCKYFKVIWGYSACICVSLCSLRQFTYTKYLMADEKMEMS